MYPDFFSAEELQQKIDDYFNSLNCVAGINPDKASVAKRLPEISPPTISGLMLFLGFNSRSQFEEYEIAGPFAEILKRARLQVEAEYEKKLHYQSSTGAIFALKSMGWNERVESSFTGTAPVLQIQIINNDYKPATSEGEVDL